MGLVINNGVLVKYEGSEKEVVIPNGVTCIGAKAFFRNDTIESVIIPDSVETIEEYAFLGCKGIKSLDIPKSVKTIGYMAFNHCSLEKVTIPPTVKEVIFGAFNGVKEITVYDNFQSSIAELWDFFTRKEFSFAVTVLSKDTGMIISRVPICSDGSYPNRYLIQDCCRGDDLFDLPLLDKNFKKLKSPKVRTFIAEFRLNNPYDLTDESREMYAKYLKRTANRRAKESKYFEIKGKTLIRYKATDTLSVVQVPEGIKKLGIEAFGQEDHTITDIILPEGLTTIDGPLYCGNMVFKGCRKLKRVVVPDTLVDVPYDAFDIYARTDDSEEYEKVKLEFNEYDNGLYLGNDGNPYVCLVDVSNERIESLKVHEGCKVICANALIHCKKLRKIVLPDSLVKIEEPSGREWIERLGRYVDAQNIYKKYVLEINMPSNYFRTPMKLPNRVTYDLLYLKWQKQVTLTDLAWIYLFQPGKNFEEFCERRFTDENQAVKEMLAVCTEKPSETVIEKLAKYAYSAYSDKAVIQKDQLLEIVQLAEREGVTSDELDQLKIIAGVASQADIDPLDHYCREKYDSKTIDDIIRRTGLYLDTTLKKCPVKYKETKKGASQFVLKCVIAQYIDSFSGNEPKARIIKDADELAAKLDSKMFSKFIYKITERPMTHALVHYEYRGIEPADRLLSLVGRFGDERSLDRLIYGYEGVESKNVGIDRSTKLSICQNYLKAAILLNDSQKALSYCIEEGWGREYASIRGKKLYELDNMAATDEEREIVEAISIYEDVVTKIKELVADDGTYSDPTVSEAPIISRIRSDNEKAHKFYATLRDFYTNKTHKGSNDYRFSPEELYNNWINNDRVEDGHIGISFPIGLLVASYMFESKDIKGRLVFCRNYWEYTGNASEPTRIVLEVSSDADKWKAFVK